MINLQRMINPLGPSPKAVEAIKNNLENIHQYVGPFQELIKKLAKINQVKEEQILLTDGADGALTLIALSVFKDTKVIIPQPCFHRYKDYPSYLGVEYNFIPPKDCLCIDEEKVLQAKGDVLLLASPNNPTGFVISESFLKKSLEHFTYVILDETLLLSLEGKHQLVAQYPQLIIVRSFSKLFGLAGLRIGYIIASQENIKKIKAVVTPFKVNYLGQIAALAALDDEEYIENSKRYIEREKEKLYKACKQESIRLSQSLCYCLSLNEQEATDLKKSVLLFDDFKYVGISDKKIHRLCIGQPQENEAVSKIIGGLQCRT